MTLKFHKGVYGFMKNNTVWSKFSEVADAYPERSAVMDHRGSTTYGQLQEQASRWAAHIRETVGEGALIGIMTEHSADQIAAMLGVLAAGCGYIPMEPDFPQERVNSMIEDGKVKTVITQEEYVHRFDGNIRVLCTDKPVKLPVEAWTGGEGDESSVAYVLFTSGTTGRPKGVMVSHGNLLHYVQAFQQEFRLTPEDRVLQMSVVNFDIYVEEVYPALLNGSCVCVLDPKLKDDVDQVVDYCNHVGVTVISSFPYFLQAVNENGRFPEHVRVYISGGDVLHEHYVDKLLQHTPVYNTYGPTETTVCAAYYRCEVGKRFGGERIPIGLPVHGAGMEILDEKLRPLGPEEIGEICISGSGVSLGYLNRSEETARAFVPDPASPGRYRYLSGDMGYRNQNGEFVFINRKDGQVMIQGRRVECMEVEQVLNQCPETVQAVVKAVQDEQGYPHLVAFLRLEKAAELQTVKEYLERYLLDYMIPEHYVLCKQFPLTTSGKVDRRLLTFSLAS